MSASRAWPEGTDELLEEILTDAYGEDEQLWALRQAFEDDVSLPVAREGAGNGRARTHILYAAT